METLNHDTLRELCYRLDDQTLRKFAENSRLWKEVTAMLDDPEFWYHRTEHLAGRSLTPRPNTAWNDVYYGLVKAKMANNEDVTRASWSNSQVEPRDLSSKLYRPGLSDLGTLLVLEEVYGKPAPTPADYRKNEIYAHIASVPVLRYLVETRYLSDDEASMLQHLHYASSYGRTAVVSELLRMLGPKVGLHRYVLIDDLITAATNHHPDVIKEIASVVTVEHEEWYRALSASISDRAINSVQYLLDTVDYTDEEIESTLPIALTQTQNDQIAAMLIRAANLSPDVARDIFTRAVVNGLAHSARALIELYPELNLPQKLDYNTLLRAIEKNQPSTVALILEYISPAHRTNQALKKAAAIDGDVFKLVLADSELDPNKDLTAVLKAIITQQASHSQTKMRQILSDVEKSKPFTVRRYTDLGMISGRELASPREEPANALILDPRIKVENLSQTDIRLFVYALESHLSDRVKGIETAAGIAGVQVTTASALGAPPTTAQLGTEFERSLLLRYIMLKRPSGVELLDWCIARRDPTYEKAARQVVLSGGVALSYPELIPIESLYAIILYTKFSVEELLYGLREAGVRPDVIRDTAILIGAYLGQRAIEARSPPRLPPPE